MKKAAWIVACAMVFLSAAASAQTPAAARVHLAAIFDQPGGGSCVTPESAVLFAAKVPGPGPQAACTATASCGDDGFVNCSGNSTCSAVDRNCPSEQGRVTCDGNTTLCPACESCGGPVCCSCQNTGSCVACCMCDGGTARQCGEACS